MTFAANDLALQPYSRDTLVHLSRGITADIFLFRGRLGRKGWVTAQFETGQQAQEYAETHSLDRPDSRHRAVRIELLQELLTEFPEGELLDPGCGPGVLVRSLLDSPAYDYRITILDQSEAMIQDWLLYRPAVRSLAGLCGSWGSPAGATTVRAGLGSAR